MTTRRVAIALALALLVGGAGLADATADLKACKAEDLAGAVKATAELLEQKNMTLTYAVKDKVILALATALDPRAEFVDKARLDTIREAEKGIFWDAGIKVEFKQNWPMVEDVVKGGPASGADVKAGDRIEKIGEFSTQGATHAKVFELLRAGDKAGITLSLRAKGRSEEPRKVEIKRKKEPAGALSAAEHWPQNIAYIRLNGLFEGAGAQLTDKIQAVANAKTYGLILDLRGAGGPDLAAAADAAAFFTKPGAPLFKVEDGSGREIRAYPAREAAALAISVMVLVNGETRDAAETLAALLSRCKDVLLIGEATSGDDRIRDVVILPDGRQLRVATARVAMAGGAGYRDTGVAPAIEIPADLAAREAAAYVPEESEGFQSDLTEKEKDDKALRARIGGDAVLKRAVDILMSLKALDMRGR